jgi:hypothetical protein
MKLETSPGLFRQAFRHACTLISAALIMTISMSHCDADGIRSLNVSTVAQVGPPPPAVPPAPLDRNTLYRVVGLVAATLIITFLCWYVAYPAILRKGKFWPVTLFGVVTAVAWCSSWLLGLYLFYDKLTIAPSPFTKREGLRILVAVIAVGFAYVWARLWRSQNQNAQ